MKQLRAFIAGAVMGDACTDDIANAVTATNAHSEVSLDNVNVADKIAAILPQTKLVCIKPLAIQDGHATAFVEGATYLVHSTHHTDNPPYVRIVDLQGVPYKVLALDLLECFRGAYLPFRDGWCCAQCGTRTGVEHRHNDKAGDYYLCHACNTAYMQKLRAHQERELRRWSPEDGCYYDEEDN